VPFVLDNERVKAADVLNALLTESAACPLDIATKSVTETDTTIGIAGSTWPGGMIGFAAERVAIVQTDRLLGPAGRKSGSPVREGGERDPRSAS